MVETILQYLAWAIPSGGIGAAIAWFANRNVRKTTEAKQIHDTYKEMYEDVSAELRAIRNENGEILERADKASQESRILKRALDRLSRAIEAIQFCPYRAECPVRAELQDGEEYGVVGGVESAPASLRQQRKRKHKKGDSSCGTSGHCGADDSSGQLQASSP